ncbi:hypothetical protein pmac_cds_633 [Pandoravirus macleodensis]|uniref:Uncharacterized protein n=1 Tax=Pandoravirus macleodensis TaxID=2107707 RepID=A0A2U7UH36_9VIRU|nr:hypothetical protein pmac_cds_633 [Pandoravirus macleodensis]AVK77321.1 hypothetical protein pmac_cds_633 [Pandoravirus macleodensis]UMO80071.1 hypothetical protein [Pandoravirus aubagnensis]
MTAAPATTKGEIKVRFREASGTGCLVRTGEKRPIAVGACDSPEAQWLVRHLQTGNGARIVSAQGGDCADIYDPQSPVPYTWPCRDGVGLSTEPPVNQIFDGGSLGSWRGIPLSVPSPEGALRYGVGVPGRWLTEPWAAAPATATVVTVTGPPPEAQESPTKEVAAVMANPDDTPAAARLAAWVGGSAERRGRAWDEIVRLVAAHPNVFPTRGVIRRLGAYAYLDVQDDGAYVTRVPAALDAVERGYGVAKLLQAPSPPGWQQYRVYAPPSPVGTHVTLGGASPPPSWLGQEVRFRVEGLLTYLHDRLGRAPSGFDPRFYPYRWYVMPVTLLDPPLAGLFWSDPPHISVGVLGRRA